jgi:predicted extracellular nuclease
LIAATSLVASLVLIHQHVSADTGTGSVSLTTLGAPVTENFDTLSNVAGSTTNTTLPVGWYITEQGGGARDNEQYAVDTGGSTTGDIYSYGSAGSTDRALGALRSGTLIPFYGARFTNNTGSTITSLNVTYTGEEWRLGAAGRTDRIDFQISTNATDLTTGTFTDVDALDFTTPDTVTAGAKNGNAAADRTTISSTISSLNIPNGATFVIRWIDFDPTGADDGLSVDDFSLTPNTGAVTPTLSINDVALAEGNAGTTTFTFTVSLSAPAPPSGVSFDIATADGTAQDGNPVGEDNDYVAKSLLNQVIPSGSSSYSFTVVVNGDTTTEPNETFFVNVTNISGATPVDTQGQGTIVNDDVTITPIHDIQGNGSVSPLVSLNLTTRGVVTGLKSNGFFLQTDDVDVDADPNTSEGIFVFTSSAPPAAAAIGNRVNVTGTVQEFVPSADPFSPPMTELTTPSVVLLSTGNPLPFPILLTAAETTQASETANPLDSLEEYEGMRVSVASLAVSGPTQASINEPNALATSNGIFFGVVTGVARPFREAGINVSDPLPSGAPATIPRFDENPERIRVDSDAQPGTTAIDVAAGTVITNLVGPLDYAFRCYTIDPDASSPPTVGTQPGSTPAPAATADEFTVASFNMERFFDTTDDPGVSDAVLTATAFNRRVSKASLIIRTVQRYPDVIGVEEMENLTTLQAVATQINNDAVNLDGLPNPNYTAYLVEGNDVGGIDVGFLVKQSRISVIDVTQLSKTTTYTNPNTGAQDLLNDRPPLVLRATCPRPLGGNLPFTVIVNHLRSLNGIDDNTAEGLGTAGGRVRAKRRAQAEDLANIIQARQVADPSELIITVGDMNAFNVNDGYVDVIGTVKGTPAPASQVTLASPDLVNPDLTDLVDVLPSSQQYSYNFDGNAQTLDHIILNRKALVFLTRFAYARNDSDFAVKNYESTNELRISDHDQPVAYFNLTLAPSAADGTISGRIVDDHGQPVAGTVVALNGTQNRKTITDANGAYVFANVETNGFYTVTPTRANFGFSPSERSFSQLMNRTEALFTAVSTGDSVNPLETAEFFVRQQYLDLLGREPDEGGFNYWSDQINQCDHDQTCIRNKRIDVANAFFFEPEHQKTSAYVFRLYRSAFGNDQPVSNPDSSNRPEAKKIPSYTAFVADRATIVAGADLRTGLRALANQFVQRPEFFAKYPATQDGPTFISAVLATINNDLGVDLTSQSAVLLTLFNQNGGGAAGRGAVMYQLADPNATNSISDAEYNRAFVFSQYSGYLRRDSDIAGFLFWLGQVNSAPLRDVSAQHSMVCAFITSPEYQRRFSRIITRSNAECRR